MAEKDTTEKILEAYNEACTGDIAAAECDDGRPSF